MRLREDKIRRIAERVIDDLQDRGLVKYTTAGSGARAERVKVVYDVIARDMQVEVEIDTEVDRIIGTYSRTLKATEQDILRRKHKDEVAKRRGFEL